MPADDDEVLAAFQLLSQTEGIIPALESAHALAWLVREAQRTVPAGATVLVTLSGRGDKDVAQVRDDAGRSEALELAPAPRATSGATRRGRKLLVAYVTGGMSPDWCESVHALALGGADAIEVGIPFSDPMIDGPTIQESSLQALRRGTTPATVIDALARADVGVPLCVMTYYNIVFRAGLRRFAALAGRRRDRGGHHPRPAARGSGSLVRRGRRRRESRPCCWWRPPHPRSGHGGCAPVPAASSTAWG